MTALQLTSAYEWAVVALSMVGLAQSLPLLRQELKDKAKLQRKKINGEMLATASECVWQAWVPVVTHSVLMYTCVWRAMHPTLANHFIPSTSRLILSIFLLVVVGVVRSNRKIYRHRSESAPEVSKVVLEQSARMPVESSLSEEKVFGDPKPQREE